MNAGDFKKTVMLRNFTESSEDGLGHKTRTYADVRKCAARLWQRTAAEVSNDPGEFPAGQLRLLLWMPPATTAIGWHMVYESATYEIIDQEWRDEETTLLCQLVKD